uniref:methionine--tRNA ligase n=1 Tax=Marseillevirus LCMAC201 TaxID=2506605 RepID=A0A481YYP7_9VIRU|nr:MAG: methionyl-tRNA synthetase [Marseillevirus LCMAC201]
MTQYLITSALPYVNNVPHLGNLIGSTLSADFYARYCRLRKRQVLFICGSDCYGTASEVKAQEAGVTPAVLCEKYHQLHKDVYVWFDISFDIYGKTSTPTHTGIVTGISHDLERNSYLDSQIVQQLYCGVCDTSLADRYVKGTCPFCGKEARGDQCDATDCGKILHALNLINPVCAVCGGTPTLKDSKHIFLNLEKCQPQLEEWVSSARARWSTNAVGSTRGWLTKGLEPRCITRDLKWGTPVPRLLDEDWPDKVFYVWYDAPIGYISITACERDDWRSWWQAPDKTRLYQFMAKDNIPFHTVMFPAMLQATGQAWTLVTDICATEYLNFEGRKFSKSKGVGIFADRIQNAGIPADYWRYYLATIRPERSDSNFDRNGFKMAIDELADKYGNLVNRVLNLIKKYRDGYPLPLTSIATRESDQEFQDAVEKLHMEYHDAFDSVKIIAAVQLALQVAQEANKYLYQREPWKLQDPDRRDIICTVALQTVYQCSVMLAPIIPTIHKTFCGYLGLADGAEDVLDVGEVHIQNFAPLIDKQCVQKIEIY